MRKLLLLLCLLSVSSFVISADFAENARNFKQVSVEHSGSWQWGADKFATMTFSDLYHTSFYYDVEKNTLEEGYIQITYQLGDAKRIWRIEMFRPKTSGFLSTEVNFNVFKNGVRCESFTETLPVNGVKTIDLLTSCGTKFEASWERFTLETNVYLTHFVFAQGDLQSVKSEFFKSANIDQLKSIDSTLETVNQKFRVFDIKHPLQFQKVTDKPFVALRSVKDYFAEEDDTGATRVMVLTNDGKIEYIVWIERAVFEDFVVFKPKKTINAVDFTSFAQLRNFIDEREVGGGVGYQNVVEVAYQDGESVDWSAIEGATVVGAASTVAIGAVTTGTLFVSGSTLVVLSGGIGIPILVAGAIVGGSVWYFTDTDTYVYDGGRLIINWDNTTGWNEKQVNWIMFRESGLAEGQSIDSGISRNEWLPIDVVWPVAKYSYLAKVDAAKTFETLKGYTQSYDPANPTAAAEIPGFDKKLVGTTYYVRLPAAWDAASGTKYYIVVYPKDSSDKNLDNGGQLVITWEGEEDRQYLEAQP